MVALLIGLLVAAGPVLRGAWDLWAQTLLFLAVGGGFALWLVGRLIVGYVPLPSRRVLLWTAALAVLSGAAAFLSPLAAYAVPSWRALLLALWIFPALDVVSKDERAGIDQAVRAASWVLVLLAFYQHFRDGIPRPPSALLNQNVFAGTILMLLPLAAQKEDWLLCGGLFVCLAWSHSVGAWLGLAGAMLLAGRGSALARRAGAAVGLVCLVLIYGKLQDPEVLHRWGWWTAAARLIRMRPALGFGPGSFGYALPAVRVPGTDLSSLFAHQFFLETGAECGLAYLLLWTAGIVHLLHRGGEHKRFGAEAVLIQCFWDYALSIPANLWLFCYFAASSGSQTSRGVNVPLRLKAPLAALVVGVYAAVGGWAWTRWQADRVKAAAVESFRQGAPVSAVLAELRRAAALAPEPDAQRYAAELELKEGDARAAIARLERAVLLDPYRASTWAALERLYAQTGNPAAAQETRRRRNSLLPAAGSS